MTRRLGAAQAALYEAEMEALAGAGARWSRLAEVREYLDGLVSSAWFTGRWPHFVACAVERRGSGARWSTCQALDGDGPGGAPTEGVILLAPGALLQAVVLHELAHLLAPPGAGHGPAFAAVQLELVRHEMGFFAFADYREALIRRRLLAVPVSAAPVRGAPVSAGCGPPAPG